MGVLLAPFADLNCTRQTQSQGQGQGRVTAANSGPTWCPPCSEEIPERQRIQRNYVANGAEFVSIALDYTAKVRDHANKTNFDWSLVFADPEILSLDQEPRNETGVLPSIVVLQRKGMPAYVHAGALTLATLDATLHSLL